MNRARLRKLAKKLSRDHRFREAMVANEGGEQPLSYALPKWAAQQLWKHKGKVTTAAGTVIALDWLRRKNERVDKQRARQAFSSRERGVQYFNVSAGSVGVGRFAHEAAPLTRGVRIAVAAKDGGRWLGRTAGDMAKAGGAAAVTALVLRKLEQWSKKTPYAPQIQADTLGVRGYCLETGDYKYGLAYLLALSPFVHSADTKRLYKELAACPTQGIESGTKTLMVYGLGLLEGDNERRAAVQHYGSSGEELAVSYWAPLIAGGARLLAGVGGRVAAGGGARAVGSKVLTGLGHASNAAMVGQVGMSVLPKKKPPQPPQPTPPVPLKANRPAMYFFDRRKRGVVGVVPTGGPRMQRPVGYASFSDFKTRSRRVKPQIKQYRVPAGIARRLGSGFSKAVNLMGIAGSISMIKPGRKEIPIAESVPSPKRYSHTFLRNAAKRLRISSGQRAGLRMGKALPAALKENRQHLSSLIRGIRDDRFIAQHGVATLKKAQETAAAAQAAAQATVKTMRSRGIKTAVGTAVGGLGLGAVGGKLLPKRPGNVEGMQAYGVGKLITHPKLWTGIERVNSALIPVASGAQMWREHKDAKAKGRTPNYVKAGLGFTDH